MNGMNPVGAPKLDRQQALRHVCQELEAVFLRQLFEVMRTGMEDEEGLLGKSQGEEMFRSMLDDQLASEAATKIHRGLGEALYRQLSGHLNTEGE